jgi:hypothetical protein
MQGWSGKNLAINNQKTTDYQCKLTHHLTSSYLSTKNGQK